MKTHSDYQFDFTLFFNDKIICQRFFKCNNYHKNHINFNNSIEIITSATYLIKEHLKSETEDLLWKNYNSNNEKTMFYTHPKNELLKISITCNSKLIATSCIPTNAYPSKVKYNINIRPILPAIISNIRHLV